MFGEESSYMINNKNGWTLTLVLILLTIIPLLSFALYYYSSQDITHALIEERSLQAYYLARSGAKLVADDNYFEAGNTYILDFEGFEIIVVFTNEEIIRSFVELPVRGITIKEELELTIVNGNKIWSQYK